MTEIASSTRTTRCCAAACIQEQAYRISYTSLYSPRQKGLLALYNYLADSNNNNNSSSLVCLCVGKEIVPSALKQASKQTTTIRRRRGRFDIDNEDDSTTTTTTIMDWLPLPEELFLDIVSSHWDVATLVEKKQVSREWKQLCTNAIDAKRTKTTQKTLQTKDELLDAVKIYCGYNQNTRQCTELCSRKDAEEIATTYGWPINKWDVSNVQDLSRIFSDNWYFNEYIGSWNVSNATSMHGMFCNACAFNQDISSWDVSNVTDMAGMFGGARNFNQDLSSWNTGNVTNMSGMFCSTPFNPNVSRWDTSL
jgi:surface protein